MGRVQLRKKKPNYVSKFNVESLKQESTKDLYARRLKEKIALNKITEEDDIETAWKRIKENITNSATEAIGLRTTDTNKPKNKPWFTQEIKDLAREKREAYIKFINNRTPVEYERYKEIRNRTTNEIKLKKNYWERFSTEMEHDLYGGQRRVWNMLRNRKRPVNEEVQISAIKPEMWMEYFENLYQNPNNETKEEEENSLTDPSSAAAMENDEITTEDNRQL